MKFIFYLMKIFFSYSIMVTIMMFILYSLKYTYNKFLNDFKCFYSDFQYYNTGVYYDFSNMFFIKSVKSYMTHMNDLRKYFLKKHIYTMNHKSMALNYFYFSMWTGMSGSALATMVSLELAYPGSTFFKGDSLKYLQVMTAHGLIMVFFVVVPIVFGGFANFFMPYHVGSKDVAFPRLNSMGFWMQPCGYLLLAKTAFLRPQFWSYYDKPSFFYPLLDKSFKSKYFDFKENTVFPKKGLTSFSEDEGFITWPKSSSNFIFENFQFLSWMPSKLVNWPAIVNYPESFWYSATKAVKARSKKVFFTKCSNSTLTMSGWTFMTPFSSNTKYTGVGSQDMAVLGVIFAGVSTTMSFTNLLMTRSTLSMPGLSYSSVLLPFISIALFLTMSMLVLMTPVLAAAMMMLALDSHWQTTFFDYVYGGDTILFQHLFWFFGHPEVYVVMIPVFGFINMILPYSNTSRIASKHHLMWAMYMMAYMGFIVWGHHMYLVGLDHRSSALYSTITVMMSLPATVKVVNWTMTLLNGALKWDVALLFSLSFMIFFLGGGLTGMWLSHVALNVSMHDTFYVVAHFHLMFSASTFTGTFAAMYYYFPALFGMKYSSFFAYMHLMYFTGGQWMTFLPLFWMGYSGMPSRIHDYPAFMMGWHGMATVGHMTTMVSVIFFFLMLLDSHIESRVAVHSSLGLPRWHKRMLYYTFKISYLQLVSKKLNKMPNSKVSLLLSQPYFNEVHYEDDN